MSNGRTERIESIILKRKPFVGRIEATRRNLEKVLSHFDTLLPICRSVLDDASLAEDFGKVSELVNSCIRPIDEIRRLRDDLAHIQNRFSRDTLNIAVIGRARQGKSRLLQTITGLSAEEIPDGNQAFCTGVRSDIINTTATETAYAQVNFLTEREFIDEKIAPYFRDLQEFKADLFTPVTVNEFMTMKLPEPGTFKASPETETSMNLHLKHLQDLQEHLSQYKEFIGHAPIRIAKEEIREYVAQDNKAGERVFFKHMAVSNVEIFCKFPNQDVGKLRLIDLPGLGDTRKGDAEQVVRALSDQVDLVIFLSKPSNSGAAWQDNEVNLYSQARRALGEKLPIESWSFWVFNHDSRQGSDNSTQCRLLKDSMSAAQIQVSDTVIADCTKLDEVNGKLIDKVLDFLAGNIECNDAEYSERLQNDILQAVKQLESNFSKIQELLREDKNADIDAGMFDDLFDPFWEDLKADIQACVGEGADIRYNKNKPCIPLKESIDKIINEAENGEALPIDIDTIKRRNASKGDPLSFYYECLHRLRTKLSTIMQADMDSILDQVLSNMKDRFGHVLGSTGRLATKFGSDDHLLLGKLIQYIKESGQSERMPTILRGLEFLDSWKLSYRSFAQHRIREALNCLDPLDEANQKQGTPKNEEQAIDLLHDLYEQAGYELRKKFDGPGGIYPEPNNAAFAAAEEFKDIMIRSGDSEAQLRNEWKRLYRPISGDIWPEEYGSSQKIRDASSRITMPLNEILTVLRNTSNFSFRH